MPNSGIIGEFYTACSRCHRISYCRDTWSDEFGTDRKIIECGISEEFAEWLWADTVSSVKCLYTGWHVFNSWAGRGLFLFIIASLLALRTTKPIQWHWWCFLQSKGCQQMSLQLPSISCWGIELYLHSCCSWLSPTAVGWMWPRQCGDKDHATSNRENIYQFIVLCDHAAGLPGLNVTC